MEKIVALKNSLEDLEQYVITLRPHPAGPGGGQIVMRFPNGFGASIVRFYGSYGYQSGRFELAVVKFIGDGADDYELTYRTPITNDVIGYLDYEECIENIRAILALGEGDDNYDWYADDDEDEWED